jgi:hypothetical protein
MYEKSRMLVWIGTNETIRTDIPDHLDREHDRLAGHVTSIEGIAMEGTRTQKKLETVDAQHADYELGFYATATVEVDAKLLQAAADEAGIAFDPDTEDEEALAEWNDVIFETATVVLEGIVERENLTLKILDRV